MQCMITVGMKTSRVGANISEIAICANLDKENHLEIQRHALPLKNKKTVRACARNMHRPAGLFLASENDDY